MAPSYPEIEGQGRWTPREHAIFMQGLQQRPSISWKEISEMVKTRSARQTRTHAQKYFQKLARRQRRAEKNSRKVGGAATNKPLKKSKTLPAPEPLFEGQHNNVKSHLSMLNDNQHFVLTTDAGRSGVHAGLPQLTHSYSIDSAATTASSSSNKSLLSDLDTSCFEALNSVFPNLGQKNTATQQQMPRKLDLEAYESQFFAVNFELAI